MGQRSNKNIANYIFSIQKVQLDGSQNICSNLLRVTLHATSYAVWHGSVILNGGSQRVSLKCHLQQWSERIILTKPNKKLCYKDVNVLDTSKWRERAWHFPNLTPARKSDIPEHTENTAFELRGRGSLEDGFRRDKLPAGAWKLEREMQDTICRGWTGQNNPSEAFCEAKYCLQPDLRPMEMVNIIII